MASRFIHAIRPLTAGLVIVAAIGVGVFISYQHGRSLQAHAALPSSYTLPYNSVDFKSDVIYEVLLDRFFDGDSSNNDPSGDSGLYSADKSNWKLYWGGDLKGLTQKLQYISDMGVTALWILPPFDNIHTSAFTAGSSAPNAGYHGYWTRDFYKIDPHLGTWSDFDTLVSSAHSKGIKVIIDFAPNHSNPNDTAEYGSIYNNGTFQAAYNNDPNGWFHHNPAISDYNNLYQDEYDSLSDLSDLAQENPSVDSYLRGAMSALLSHGIDGIRLDATKHMPSLTGGWSRTLADLIYNNGPHYMVGEWYTSSISDPTYSASTRFANNSGIADLNFPLNTVLRSVFAQNGAANQIDSILTQEASNFTWLNDQANFLDSHDMPRLGTLNSSQSTMNLALASLLTLPGIPIVYYGNEQYLHNDTSGGGDPYNRLMMSGFDETTTAFQVTQKLAAIRHSNPALAYGTYLQRWMNSDVFIYERQFYNNVVLFAVNKSSSASYTISGLNTNLPAGTYSDGMNSLLGGNSITVGSGGAVNNFSLGPGKAAVWQYQSSEPSTPEIGSAGPELVRSGDQMIIDGQGFGSSGTVEIGGVTATASSYSTHSIKVTVPSGAPAGLQNVQICTSTCSNNYKVNVETAAQVPVTFTVNNAPSTNFGDNVYLVGNVAELGNWGTTTSTAIGPMLCPNYPNWFLLQSVPANTAIQFKFIIIRSDGSVQWENGSNHTYTTPGSGPGNVTVTWQN
jgi:glycosidase